MAKRIYLTDPIISTLYGELNSLRSKALGAAGGFHIDASEVTVLGTNGSDLASDIALLNECKRVFNGGAAVPGGWIGHLHDADGYKANGVPGVAHKADDTANVVTSADATDQASADTLATEIKAKFNAHLTQAGVHYNNDAANAVTAGDGDGTEATLRTLVNQIKAKINLHVASALPGNSYRVMAG